MKKRAYGLFFLIVAMFCAGIFSIVRVSGSAEYVTAAGSQSIYELNVSKARGTIYDRNLEPLVGGDSREVYAIAPTIESIGLLEKTTGGEYREQLAAALEGGKPFLMELPREVVHPCIDSFFIPERYGESSLATHVIGYTDGYGNGVSGIELAMDDVLSRATGELSIYYRVDAMGRVIPGASRKIENTLGASNGGVKLTLDREIQELAEQAAERIPDGAVVVSSVPQGEICALVSRPDFNQNDIGQAVEEDNAPLVNRAFSAYAPGSVFKLVTAAAQLESGGVADFTCNGSVNADGLSFHCIHSTAHGLVNLQTALEKSCNCYFISAARSLGGQAVLTMAYNMGLGVGQEFGRGLVSDPGILPQGESLLNVRALANFSFGQGELAVTPLQVNAMMNAIASGGEYVSPSLISAVVDGNLNQTSVSPADKRQVRIMEKSTAMCLQNYLISTAVKGTAAAGAPDNVTVGAKTGTAQTGVYNEEGEELLHFWYTGFVEGDSGPAYTITVLAASTPDDEGAAAQAFREISQGLGELEK